MGDTLIALPRPLLGGWALPPPTPSSSRAVPLLPTTAPSLAVGPAHPTGGCLCMPSAHRRQERLSTRPNGEFSSRWGLGPPGPLLKAPCSLTDLLPHPGGRCLQGPEFRCPDTLLFVTYSSSLHENVEEPYSTPQPPSCPRRL